MKLEARTKVVEQRGEVSARENLKKRVACFSSGVAIGGEDFVKGVAARYQEAWGRKNERSPRSVSGKEGRVFVMR